MSEKSYWLKCETIEGMFPDEMGVVSKTSEGQPFSLFADLDFIKNKDQIGENLLKVLLCKTNSSSCLIKLPADPFETRKFVSVSKDQVVEFAS